MKQKKQKTPNKTQNKKTITKTELKELSKLNITVRTSNSCPGMNLYYENSYVGKYYHNWRIKDQNCLFVEKIQNVALNDKLELTFQNKIELKELDVYVETDSFDKVKHCLIGYITAKNLLTKISKM